MHPYPLQTPAQGLAQSTGPGNVLVDVRKGRGGRAEAWARCQKSWVTYYLACDLEPVPHHLWSAIPKSLGSLQPVMGCETLIPKGEGGALKELSRSGVSQVLPARLRQWPDRSRREKVRAGVSHIFTLSPVSLSLAPSKTIITISKTAILTNSAVPPSTAPAPPEPSWSSTLLSSHHPQNFYIIISARVFTEIMWQATHTQDCVLLPSGTVSRSSLDPMAQQRTWHILEAPGCDLKEGRARWLMVWPRGLVPLTPAGVANRESWNRMGSRSRMSPVTFLCHCPLPWLLRTNRATT